MAEADLKMQGTPHRWPEQVTSTSPETVDRHHSEERPNPGGTLHMWQRDELQMPWVPNHSRNLLADDGDSRARHVGLGGEQKARLSSRWKEPQGDVAVWFAGSFSHWPGSWTAGSDPESRERRAEVKTEVGPLLGFLHPPHPSLHSSDPFSFLSESLSCSRAPQNEHLWPVGQAFMYGQLINVGQYVLGWIPLFLTSGPRYMKLLCLTSVKPDMSPHLPMALKEQSHFHWEPLSWTFWKLHGQKILKKGGVALSHCR